MQKHKVPPESEFHKDPGGTVVRRPLFYHQAFVGGIHTFDVEGIKYRVCAVLQRKDQVARLAVVSETLVFVGGARR